ncbi:MAG: hypothetical protein NTW21_41065, partial [Verrucomicrobia bacterium]|nr:hypothetical protein [Verrucomicrobiota bacterium]
ASAFSGEGVVPGSQLNLRIECLNATVYLDDVTLSTSLTDTTAPTLASANIVDNKSGGPVNPGQRVTYSVTFSEAMNSGTVSSSNFDNGGTAAVLIGTPTTTDGIQYQIPVVATGTGTLQLRVPVGATMTDLADLPLDTSSEILDDTTINVVAKPIGVTGGDFENPTVTSQTGDIPLWFDNTAAYADWLQPANHDFGTSHGSQCVLLMRFVGNRGYIYQSLGQLEAGASSLDWSFDHVRYNPALRTTATGTAEMRFFHGVSLAATDGADIDTLGFTQIGSTIGIPGVTSSDAHLSGSVDVSSVPAGATIWVDFTYTGNVDDGQEFMLDNIVTLVDTPTAGYAAWQATNGATGTINEDHDNDGVPNGIEYFLGGNTNTTGFTALPGVSNSGGTLSVPWTKGTGYTGTYGTDYFVETSATLTGTWTAEASPGNVTITGSDVTFTFPSPLGSRKFARLKVTGP